MGRNILARNEETERVSEGSASEKCASSAKNRNRKSSRGGKKSVRERRREYLQPLECLRGASIIQALSRRHIHRQKGGARGAGLKGEKGASVPSFSLNAGKEKKKSFPKKNERISFTVKEKVKEEKIWSRQRAARRSTSQSMRRLKSKSIK